VKWTDVIIEPAQPKDVVSLVPILVELRLNPGRWAELDRYPLDRIQSARSRGANIKKRNPGIEYAVLAEDSDAVLYLRQEPTEVAQ
jgi:hypothetical protein